MSRKNDANKYWIYGEDAALAARFTKYLTKVLYARRASYIRDKMVEVSTVLIVLRQCAMLYLSTADSARLNLKEVNLWSQDICKKRMVSIMWY